MKAFRVSSLVALAVAAALSGCAATQDMADSAMDSAKSMAGQPQVNRQAVAPSLYELAYSPSQDALYVVSAGGFDVNTSPSKVLRLDPKTLAVKAEIALPVPGFGLALDDEAHRLYISNTRVGSMTVVDVANDSVVGTVKVDPQQAAAGSMDPAKAAKFKYREVLLDKARHRVYLPALAYSNDSALHVVNTDTLQVEKVVPGLGYSATGIALDDAAGKIYVSNLAGQVNVVDAGTLTVSNKFDVDADQILDVKVDSANRRLLAVDEGFDKVDAKREREGFKYTPHGKGNKVVAINPANGQVTQTFTVGTQPVALLLDAQRNRFFVSNRESGNVAIIDARTGAVLKTVDLPRHPNSMALNQKTGEVYVSVKNSGDDSPDAKESVAVIKY